MKNKILALLVTSLSLTMAACNNSKPEEGPKTFTYDYTYFNGICALSGEFNNGVDYGLTNAWTASKAKALKAKSIRIWIAMSGLFSVGDHDDLTVNQGYYNVMKDHVDSLVEAGVENFLCMYSAYVYPTGYVPTTGYVVPDPNEEYDDYIRFLNLQAEATKQMKIMFPMINNFEPGNEPDFACAPCIHKNGFIHGGGMEVNFNYVYNDDDKTSILCDLCWYIRRAIKEVDDKARVVFPGLTNQYTVPDFIDLVYQKIESKCLPAGQTYSDIDPDNYFDVLNWHPYPTQLREDGSVKWNQWVEYNKELYDVVIKHGDEGKEVYFSELGWTDWGTGDIDAQNRIAENYRSAFENIKAEMPWVTAVFVFRLTNLIYQTLDETGGEENFGIFYHPNDPVKPGQPKPAAITIAKLFNGEDYNLEEHL